MNKGHSFGTSKMITLRDGRKLHYMEQGTEGPTVVFESGLGFSRNAWGLVQPIVGQKVRAVVYDRAGTGKSEAYTSPRTIEAISKDLNELLTALGAGPFILVGHSFGGAIVRAAVEANTERIRGIVLVDQSDENCELYFSKLARANFAFSRWLFPILARTNLYYKLGIKAGSVQPADVVIDHHKEDFTYTAACTAAEETKYFIQGLERLKQNPPKLEDVEVIVISGTKITASDRKIRPKLIDAHKKTAASHFNARWVEAANSGHNVMFSEPEIIVNEIFSMID